MGSTTHMQATDVAAAAAKKQKQSAEAGAEPAGQEDEAEDDEDNEADEDEVTEEGSDEESEEEEETSEEESSDEVTAPPHPCSCTTQCACHGCPSCHHRSCGPSGMLHRPHDRRCCMSRTAAAMRAARRTARRSGRSAWRGRSRCARRASRLPWSPAPRTTCAPPSAASWAMSTQVCTGCPGGTAVFCPPPPAFV